MAMTVDNRVQPIDQNQIPADYADLYSRFTAEEMSYIVQLKRFFECVTGDQSFRKSVAIGQFTSEQLAYLREVGVTFDIEELAILWTAKGEGGPIVNSLQDMFSLEHLSAELHQELKRYPLMSLWGRFNLLKNSMHRRHNQSIPTDYMSSISPEFTAWRRRRIAATKNELGSFGYILDHPTLAIELAVGCSVGCYFCAFGAPKLQQVFDYNVLENRKLFRTIASGLTEIIGARPAGHALLYWSTEPHDNPHYIDFMKTYQAITGVPVCTSTARFDEEWILSLIRFYRPHSLPWPRISVLSKKVMQRLHRQFTPDMLRDVTLLMQQRDSEELREKVPGGRPKMLQRLDSIQDLRTMEEGNEAENSAPQGSIACVSGFLINIIDKTIKLTSPCYTTPQYPYGYRVYDEATFETGQDFVHELQRMIARKMAVAPYPDMPLQFRDDFLYQPKPHGFDLVSPFQRQHFQDNPVWRPLGDILAQGDLTYQQTCNKLLEIHQCNPILVAVMIKNLFDRGFLNELDINCPV